MRVRMIKYALAPVHARMENAIRVRAAGAMSYNSHHFTCYVD